mmetsp:Transcript_56014/g.127271  ORF Transcript_56014/g.127271 Transcript_56014/m.127271 type:complete len:416 (+) Transcript_56014:86-1333(+)
MAASRDVHVALNRTNEDASKNEDVHRAADRLEEARAIHKKYPLIDGHNDLPWALHEGFDHQLGLVDLSQNLSGKKFEKIRHQCLHTDIPRCREGGLGGQFWSVYVPYSCQGGDAVQKTLEQIDVVHRMCEKYPETFEFAPSAAAARRIFGEGKIACLMGAEGGHQINNSLAVLRMYHRLGVRYLTLTHNGGPVWADPALEADGTWLVEPKVGGLSPFGLEVVNEMNRLGMVVDISHVHEATMNAVLDCTKAPVMFSHSSSKALCAHPRDVPDSVVRRTQANGGVVMINFCAKFVAGPFWVSGGRVGASLIEVADHVDHLRGVCGGQVDHIGLGADYDGIVDTSRGLEDVSLVPYLTAELLARGYTEEECGKILGLNVLRVLARCEEVAEELQAQGALASDAKLEDLEPKHKKPKK